ncbi:MAG: domain S-box-containing protein [Mucilaginibacter sp.]|nr:domain S-box-containing protein [Mucilaginibacter sp.]
MRIDNTFGANIIPDNDLDRIFALKRYHILDTPPEVNFDKIATLAAQIFQVPVAFISFVDAERVFLKANIGLGKVTNVNRAISLCALAILKPGVTVFKDTLKESDLILRSNITNQFGLRFYAGAPLITYDGYQIGTLCIADKGPKDFTKQDERVLRWLAKQVMEEVELRLSRIKTYEQQQDMDHSLIVCEPRAANDEPAVNGKKAGIPEKNKSILQDTLNESDIRFSNMMQKAPVALAMLTGRELIIESANETILKIFGKTTAVIGMPVARALPELERQVFLKLLDDVYTSGKPYYGNETKVEVEDEGQLKDIYFNFVYYPLLDETGSAYAIMIVANDVTDLVIARKEKERAEEMLRFAIEAANVGTWYIDMKTKTFMPSPRLKQLFGYYQDDPMPYDIAVNQIVEEYRDKVIAAVKATLDSGVRFNMEFPIIGFHDQKLRWVRAVGKLNDDAKSNLSNYSGVITDITEEKQDELRKNDFIAMVNHELKTPLTSLKAYVQFVGTKLKQKEDGFIINLLKKIDTQVNKMNSLINGFLSLACLESGKIQLHKQFFNLNKLVKEIIDEASLVSQHHTITLLSCDNVRVHADREKISQVITNFLSNAIKYSPKGMLIEVKCEIVNNCARISVKDEGMGIKPQHLENLFDRYYRVENKSTSNIAGFGIGLYLCSEIIQRHNGKIGVESKVDIGSTFWFILPLHDKKIAANA